MYKRKNDEYVPLSDLMGQKAKLKFYLYIGIALIGVMFFALISVINLSNSIGDKNTIAELKSQIGATYTPVGIEVEQLLAGCLARVYSFDEDSKEDEYHNKYWTGQFIGKSISECMANTNLAPYNQQTGMFMDYGIVEAASASCIGGKVYPGNINNEPYRNRFAVCMKQLNLMWQQKGYVTPIPLPKPTVSPTQSK